MKDNELIEILKEFDEKRVEQLNDNARNLFNAIMKIADERDRLLEENKQLKENYECILKQRDDIKKNATQQIESLIDEKNKYKSLYENEKDHTDTLKRIIKKVKENLERHLTAKSYGNHKYELFGREYLEDILDLLKEIK